MSDLPTFRSVLRGYDPAQVEHHVRELATAADTARQEAAAHSVALTKLESGYAALQGELAERDERIAALERASREAERQATAPTFADLGERIGHILTLADEEAVAIRSAAEEDATGSRLAAAQQSTATRAEADRYAGDVRSQAEADAARILEQARRTADEIMEHADREASARREEAEAVYESQRAKAAAAAADFETTLAGRRDKAAADFAAQMSQHETSLAAAQERAEALTAEAQRHHDTTRSEASGLLERARSEAEALVTAAREQADRIKRDSERELAAVSARRDSITAQLTNVRQMLATLGGGAVAPAFGEVELSADAPGSPASAEEARAADLVDREVEGESGVGGDADELSEPEADREVETDGAAGSGDGAQAETADEPSDEASEDLASPERAEAVTAGRGRRR